MSRFAPGMACCNRYRTGIGLTCSIEQQLTCAASALKWQSANSPETVQRLVRDLLSTFPAHAAYLRLAAREAEALDVFVDEAALHCAALPTKTERQAYRAALVGTLDSPAYSEPLTTALSADQITRFDTLMAAEWHRLRGKPVSGEKSDFERC